MNKVNPFPALITTLQLLFLSNLSITAEAASTANLCKTSLAKGTSRSISAFFLPKLPIILPRSLL